MIRGNTNLPKISRKVEFPIVLSLKSEKNMISLEMQIQDTKLLPYFNRDSKRETQLQSEAIDLPNLVKKTNLRLKPIIGGVKVN